MTVSLAPNHKSSAASDVAVLVPAAGQGTRLGGRRKQFRTLGGQPLLVQTLLAFERHPAVDHLVVAAPSDHVRETSDGLQEAGITKLTAVVSGGASRQDSVRLALRAAPASVGVILVHDAVRPFIGPAAIRAVVDAVRTHGAAALATPVADTLRKVSGDVFGETVSRSHLFRMQTPQGARRPLFEAAHRTAARDGLTATDDVELVQHLGHDVHVVAGSTRNFKITTPDDWDLAKQRWPHWAEKVTG
ncbi:MAG: 2-C-methyl-D-erythritol 4-phosphate cytidylyltransferase [Bacteroidetes bacterium]|nr:2-C-methyl-D-erythritol 4-phosphate cytidylyltransferase [Bacteroidota bacterium]